MLVADAHQTGGCAIQRGVPGHLAPARAFADQRSAEAIGILVQVGEGRGLGTDVTAAERVILVTADRVNMLTACVDKNAARGFAQRACRDPGHSAILRAGSPSG